MGEKFLSGYLKHGLLKENMTEKFSSSSSSISLPLNVVVSSPRSTTTSPAVPPFPTSVAPQKVPKPSNTRNHMYRLLK